MWARRGPVQLVCTATRELGLRNHRRKGTAPQHPSGPGGAPQTTHRSSPPGWGRRWPRRPRAGPRPGGSAGRPCGCSGTCSAGRRSTPRRRRAPGGGSEGAAALSAGRAAPAPASPSWRPGPGQRPRRPPAGRPAPPAPPSSSTAGARRPHPTGTAGSAPSPVWRSPPPPGSLPVSLRPPRPPRHCLLDKRGLVAVLHARLGSCRGPELQQRRHVTKGTGPSWGRGRLLRSTPGPPLPGLGTMCVRSSSSGQAQGTAGGGGQAPGGRHAARRVLARRPSVCPGGQGAAPGGDASGTCGPGTGEPQAQMGLLRCIPTEAAVRG